MVGGFVRHQDNGKRFAKDIPRGKIFRMAEKVHSEVNDEAETQTCQVSRSEKNELTTSVILGEILTHASPQNGKDVLEKDIRFLHNRQ
jgi:hypothetical protein